jgi:nucleoside-diphosphate-sugar epimerase
LRVLLTGAAGFLGSHVVRRLVGRGDRVLVVLRPPTQPARIRELLEQVEVVESNLEDLRRLRTAVARFEPEALVHLAWYVRPGDYQVSPANLASLAASIGLFELALELGCPRIVGVGSCLEYAARDEAFKESDAAEPISLYAACKLSALHVGRALAARHRAQFVWARLFHVHGPGEDPARLLPWVAASLRAHRAVDLSPGSQVRDHLDVRDVAAALVHLTSHGTPGVFNVCSGVPVTLREVLLTLGRVLGHPELLHFGARPYAPEEPMCLVGDPNRLKATGWAPGETDLESSLRTASRAWQSADLNPVVS